VAETRSIKLFNHKLKHFPELQVDPEILIQRFLPNSSMCNCNGACCAEGVLLDVEEKERILAHADLIKKYLEPQQEKDTNKWFDNNLENDADFPSGRCDGTAVLGNSCVFLCSKGLCALQKTAMAEGMDKFALKPFYCVAFPITIDDHVLTTYEPEFTNRRQCCSIVSDGPLTVLDVCREEFEYILGADGFMEIEKLFHEGISISNSNIL
jgi:Fe-S-cluster containining protein